MTSIATDRPLPIWTETFPGIFGIWISTADLDDDDKTLLDRFVLETIQEIIDITDELNKPYQPTAGHLRKT